jgi:hypothetical protein
MASTKDTSNAFPDFKSLDLADRPAIETFARQFDPYSDFCFSTLLFYDFESQTRWCWLNGNLVLCLHDSYGPGTYLTFLGCEHAADTAGKLLTYAQLMNYSPVLRRVPKITATAIARESDRLRIKEDRDGFDYIYLTDSLARVKGTAFHEFRKFERRYPHHHVVTLDLYDSATLTQLRLAVSSWQPRKGAMGNVENKYQALERCFCNARNFDLLCFGVVIGETLAGFFIYERVREDWLMGHFAVINHEFKGLYGRVFYHLAQCSSESGCTHLNHQEDLGSPGLRYFKMKYAPSDFLQKFSIGQKEVLP